MRRLGWLLLGLALLLGWLQYRLWLGDGSWGEVTALQNQVAHQKRDNEGLQQRNDALAAEVEDLKSGEAAVEERARSERGKITSGDKGYRVVESSSAAPAPVAEEEAGVEPQP